MPALPPITDLTGAAITEAQAKTWFGNLRDYLSGILGTDGNVATALSAIKSLFGPGTISKTGAYTITTADRGKLVNCSGTFTLTLPAAATAGAGFAVAVRNSGAGAITLDPNASELINGAATVVVAAGSSAILVCTGAAWLTVGHSVPVSYPISIANGGTGATAWNTACDNLGAVKIDQGHGGLGCLCYAGRDLLTNTTLANPGDTVAGSLLRPASQGTFGSYFHEGALSGTWRCLGFLRNGSGDTTGVFATLWQRIA